MGFDAISTDKHRDRDAWNVILEFHAGIPNPGNRGAVIEQVSSGVDAHRRRYAQAAHKRPLIAVPLQPLDGDLAPREGSMFYSSTDNTIVITRAFLQNMHVLPLDRDVEIFGGPHGEACAAGPVEKLWFLNGVEESDHSLWRQEGLPSDSVVPGDRLAYCDVRPVEFRALQRQLVIAEDLKFPPVTVRLLLQRIMNAEYIRRLLGLQS